MPTRMVTFLLLVAALLGVSVSAETGPDHPGKASRTAIPSHAVSVPMDSWGSRPVVEARINGQGPFKLLIDTGTSFPVVLDELLATKLGLNAVGKTRPKGEAEDLDILQLSSLSIGNVEFNSIQAIRSKADECMSLVAEGIQGILGLPLFEDYLLTLDFAGKRVIIESGELPKPDGETIKYSADEEHDYGITLTLSVAGVPAKAHIDTGSPALLTLLNKYQKKLPLAGEPQVVGIARTPQGEAEVRSAVLDGVLKLGRHEWATPRIDFADLGPMLDFDAGNIGSRLLNDFVVTVDQKNHRVRFRRSESGGG